MWPTQHPSSCEARVGRPQGVGESFPGTYECSDSLESIPNRFGDFYFSTKIKILGEILENP